MLHGILVHGSLVVIMGRGRCEGTCEMDIRQGIFAFFAIFLCSVRNSKSLSWWRISAFTGVLVKFIVWYACPLFVSGAVLFCFCPKYSYDTGLRGEDNKLSHTHKIAVIREIVLHIQKREFPFVLPGIYAGPLPNGGWGLVQENMIHIFHAP